MRKVRAERTVVILTIIFINICLLIPVWQSARNTQLRWQLSQSEQELKNQEEQKMVLAARIAKQMTPEYLIEQSVVRNIVFTQIDSQTSSLVASNK
jgi:hypothetical protein